MRLKRDVLDALGKTNRNKYLRKWVPPTDDGCTRDGYKKSTYRICIIGIYLNGVCESKGKQRVSNKRKSVGIVALERFANFRYDLSVFQRAFK